MFPCTRKRKEKKKGRWINLVSDPPACDAELGAGAVAVDGAEESVEDPLFQLCEHDALLLRLYRHGGEVAVGGPEKQETPPQFSAGWKGKQPWRIELAAAERRQRAASFLLSGTVGYVSATCGN
jgi:hypothetical protein